MSPARSEISDRLPPHVRRNICRRVDRRTRVTFCFLSRPRRQRSRTVLKTSAADLVFHCSAAAAATISRHVLSAHVRPNANVVSGRRHRNRESVNTSKSSAPAPVSKTPLSPSSRVLFFDLPAVCAAAMNPLFCTYPPRPSHRRRVVDRFFLHLVFFHLFVYSLLTVAFALQAFCCWPSPAVRWPFTRPTPTSSSSPTTISTRYSRAPRYGWSSSTPRGADTVRGSCPNTQKPPKP